MQRIPVFVALPVLLAGALVLLLISLIWGSVPVPLAELPASLLNDEQSMARTVVWQLRFPRAMTALAVGALLALSGALLQVMLRNPLADPYVLGVSGGASVAALLGIMIGMPAA